MAEFLLMGGLGNQLFQLAAALESEDENATLVTDLGNPRVNQNNVPEILSFQLPAKVKLRQLDSSSYVSRKLLNLGIRVGAKAGKRNSKVLLYEFLTWIISKVVFKNGFAINLSSGTGFDSDFKINPKRLNVGYFQYTKNSPESTVEENLKSLTILNSSEMYRTLEVRAKAIKPTVVHLRLGDYLLEDSFGIPSRNYYHDAIDLLRSKSQLGSIWLFSNDPTKAMEMLPEDLKSEIFVVPNIGLTSAETLNLMRFGSAYVIANSTFSWWGAKLSFTDNPPVIIPTPWFKDGKAPTGIYPETWVQLQARYGE